MTPGTVEIKAERVIQKNSIDVYVLQHDTNGVSYLADPLTMSTIQDEGTIQKPTIELQLDQAQQLIDELYRCGLRPTQGTDDAGALEATQIHLKGMQRIAFKYLDLGD